MEFECLNCIIYSIIIIFGQGSAHDDPINVDEDYNDIPDITEVEDEVICIEYNDILGNMSIESCHLL